MSNLVRIALRKVASDFDEQHQLAKAYIDDYGFFNKPLPYPEQSFDASLRPDVQGVTHALESALFHKRNLTPALRRYTTESTAPDTWGPRNPSNPYNEFNRATHELFKNTANSPEADFVRAVRWPEIHGEDFKSGAK